MPKEKMDFFNVVELSQAFDQRENVTPLLSLADYNSRFLLAQAQQLAVISGRIEELQATWDGIGKSLRSIAVSLEKVVKSIEVDDAKEG